MVQPYYFFHCLFNFPNTIFLKSIIATNPRAYLYAKFPYMLGSIFGFPVLFHWHATHPCIDSILF